MKLSILDWLVIGAFLCVSLALGLYFSRKASRGIDDYFVSGRSLPWWLAGISMVATAFAIDTPLGITGLVAGRGIQGVWFAWAAVIGGAGAFGAFIFAALLRRSRVVTLAELIELRYAGTRAKYLRVFKAVYIGILANAITLGWVIKAVYTVFEALFPAWDPNLVLGGILLFTLVYTAVAGMWGIAATDFVQYVISTVGSVVLAIYAMRYIGGIEGIAAGFTQRYGAQEAAVRLRFFPQLGTDFFVTFVVFMTLKWWGDMPGAITQRVLSSKNERHASGATLFFSTVHFALNYWPMILVALVSLAVYPDLANPEQGYPMLMARLLPAGFLGLMLAAMTAAFMSTIDTHINMGASYIIKDLYQRFLVPEASRSHYVWASRIATVLMLLFAVVIALNLQSVRQAWYYLSLLFSGYGLAAVARWFWWRVNAWSEITALGASLLFSLTANLILAPAIPLFAGFGPKFAVVFLASSAAWIGVTLVTPPEPEPHLVRFCKAVAPYPLFWGPIRAAHPDIRWSRGLGAAAAQFLIAAAMIYAICFGVGYLLFGRMALAAVLCGGALIAAGALLVLWRRRERLNNTPEDNPPVHRRADS
jgi:Na+/proline symporter